MIDGKQLTAKLIGSEDERAVSPVIGVILMVAITVILAAVIAAFVLDLGGQVGGEASAGVNIDKDGSSNATVSVTSMGNADSVYIALPDGEGELDGDDVDDFANDGLGGAVVFTDVGDRHEFTADTDDEKFGEDVYLLEEGTHSIIATLEGEGPDAGVQTEVQTFDIENGDD